MLFTLYQLEEAAVAICLYGLYNLMCISFLSIVMIKYTGKKINFWEKEFIVP